MSRPPLHLEAVLPEPLVVSPAVAQREGALELHFALEAARAERSRRVHWTALLSLPLAVLALWPEPFSEVGRRAVLTFWAFSAIAAAWAVLAEWRLGRRARRLAPRY